MYKAFLSYAGEDRPLAKEITDALQQRSIAVWFAETELRVGDSLLRSVENGLTSSEFGILLISIHYLSKGWPLHELDVLMRQHIEEKKRLLPIWHGVGKAHIERISPGLAGIYALNTDTGVDAVVRGLSQVLIPTAATLARTSSWEDPVHRFLQGEGEATILGGATFTLWEAILHMDASGFPLRINDSTFSREELILHAYLALTGDLGDLQRRLLRSIDYERLLAVLRASGVDTSTVAYQTLPDTE